MRKTVVLVGHCGPDSSYLRMAVTSADRSVQVVVAEDADELEQLIKKGSIDLVLFNRELGWGFGADAGVDVIREMRQAHANLKMMLVSNYAEAQAAALSAGALPGFGKREIGSPKVSQLLRDALSDTAKASTG